MECRPQRPPRPSRQALPGLSRYLFDRHEPLWATGAYDAMNRRDDWVCERAFTPLGDMEQLLREHHLPLFSLESFTPLHAFDILGFTLQYDLCFTNVLTMLDLGGIPLVAVDRTREHPLVIAGGPCTANPEPMARFIDLFVVGDGEESLPEVCNLWAQLKDTHVNRETMLAEMAGRLPYVYVRDSTSRGGMAMDVRRQFIECATMCQSKLSQL